MTKHRSAEHPDDAVNQWKSDGIRSDHGLAPDSGYAARRATSSFSRGNPSTLPTGLVFRSFLRFFMYHAFLLKLVPLRSQGRDTPTMSPAASTASSSVTRAPSPDPARENLTVPVYQGGFGSLRPGFASGRNDLTFSVTANVSRGTA